MLQCLSSALMQSNAHALMAVPVTPSFAAANGLLHAQSGAKLMLLRLIQRVDLLPVDGDLGSDSGNGGSREQVRGERARNRCSTPGHLQLP